MIDSIETHIDRALSRSGKVQRLKPGTRAMDAWWALRGGGPANPELADGWRIRARIYASSWIADCLFCANAMPVAITDPRFFCSNPRCQNGGIAAADGRAIPVELPEPWAIMKIEALLLLRPRPDTRNWARPEHISDLEQENANHGIDGSKLPRAIEVCRPRWVSLFGADTVDATLAEGL